MPTLVSGLWKFTMYHATMFTTMPKSFTVQALDAEILFGYWY